MVNKSTNFQMEHEFRWFIPVEVFRQILASPNKPINITHTYRIEQLWTYTSQILKTRVRKKTVVDSSAPFTTSYTACTKYALNSIDCREFEVSIEAQEYTDILRLYSECPLEHKTRVSFSIPNHSGEIWSADLYDGSALVTIECEAEPGTKPVVPDWITDNAIEKTH